MTTYFLAAVLAGATGLGSDGSAPPNNEALERAARDYRIQVYETFHLDRPEYDLRRGEWEQIEQSWRNAGSPAAEQAKLVKWLTNATAQSGPGRGWPTAKGPSIRGSAEATEVNGCRSIRADREARQRRAALQAAESNRSQTGLGSQSSEDDRPAIESADPGAGNDAQVGDSVGKDEVSTYASVLRIHVVAEFVRTPYFANDPLNGILTNSATRSVPRRGELTSRC